MWNPGGQAAELESRFGPTLACKELPNDWQLEQAELALARAGSYQLLARLFSQELDEELLTFLRANAGFLPEVKLPDEGWQMEWLKALRVEYARLFILNVYPFASIYTGREVMLNTAETEEVRKFYTRYGFDQSAFGSSTVGSLMPDHLAVEFSFMASLIAAEERYWETGNLTWARSLTLIEQTFLAKHLLVWLPVFGLAVIRASHRDFYPALVKQSLDFICQDFHYLLEQQAEAGPQTRMANFEGEEAFLFDFSSASEKEINHPTTLKQFIHYLITPSESGFYLSKIELFRLAQALQLPIGVTERFQMLHSLVRNALDYQMLEPLLEALTGWIQDYRLELTKLQQAYPLAAHLWQPWEHQLNRSLAVVEQLGQFLRSIEPGEENSGNL